MWALLTLFTVIGRIVTQSAPCDLVSSVELKNRTYNGVRYKEGEFFYDNVTNTERGCICMKEICVRKCCDRGFVYNDTENVYECQPESQPNEFNRHLEVYQGSSYLASRGAFEPTKHFRFIYGKMDCDRIPNSVIVGLKARNLPRLFTVSFPILYTSVHFVNIS